MAINGRNYGTSGPNNVHIEEKHSSKVDSTTLNLGKVFGIMFLWLLATAAIAFGGGFLFAKWLDSAPEQAATGLMTILIVSAVALIVLTFIIQFWALRHDKGMIVLSSLYVSCMGMICSSLVLFFDWQLLGIALGLTSAIFGVLALIGLFAKNVKPIAMVGFMVLFGALIVSLFTWLFSLWLPVNTTFLWILDFAIFGAMLLLVIVDMFQIKKICENGSMSRNLTLYCALTLYTDFVYIFIKIVYYLAIAYSRK